jgi:hypothetical protein
VSVEGMGGWIQTVGEPYGNGPMHVADVRGWGHLTGRGGGCAFPEDKAIAIQEANARLIAAAPDLLAALRAVQHNRSCSCYVTVGKPCARCEVGYDEVDSAIAKAEGR